MATTTATAVTPARVPASASSVAPVRTRRSWIWIAGAAALILVGGLLNVFLFTSVGHPDEVFTVTRDIPRGTTLTAGDLSSLALSSGQRSPAISATSPSEVIGKVTTVDLPKGSLLTRTAIAVAQQIPAGRALVGLSLKPSQLPAATLAAGTHIEIVPIASTATGLASIVTSTISAVVSDTTINPQAATTIVDVYVSQSVAAELTSRAAAGSVAIYLISTNG